MVLITIDDASVSPTIVNVRIADTAQRSMVKSLSHTMVHASETAERRVDVAEFADWVRACGRDPAEALAEFLANQ